MQPLLCIMEMWQSSVPGETQTLPANPSPAPPLLWSPSPVSHPSLFPGSLPAGGSPHPKLQQFRALLSLPWKRRQDQALPWDSCAPKIQPGAAELPQNQGQTNLACEDAANNTHQRRNSDFFNASPPVFCTTRAGKREI